MTEEPLERWEAVHPKIKFLISCFAYTLAQTRRQQSSFNTNWIFWLVLCQKFNLSNWIWCHDIWQLYDIWHLQAMTFICIEILLLTLMYHDILHFTFDICYFTFYINDIGTILSLFYWWILRLSLQSENDSQSVVQSQYGSKRC